MNRVLTVVSVLILSVLLGSAAAAPEPNPATLRKLTSQVRVSEGFKADSVGTPVKVIDLTSRKQNFWLIPVLRAGRLVAVYRDDPRRESVTEIASAASLRTARTELFDSQHAAQALAAAGVEQADPVLVSCGPLSALGATNCGWYQLVGDSFVLLSLSGKLISESEVEQFWPERRAALKAFKR